MLQTLRISHFAIIDALEARFEPGFNVVSGETGAGKSILIDALHLLLGGRAQTDLVRTGFDECSVEGLFLPLDAAATDARLDALGLPPCEDGVLLVRRVVHREGRSRAFVNGALATVGQLAQATRGLVDISSQHEHTSLLDPAGHLALLDLFAGLGPEVAAYREVFDRLAASARALAALQTSEAERSRRIDYLKFQLEEIDQVDPEADEDERLKTERQRLGSAGKLREATVSAEALLYSGDGAAVEKASEAADQVQRAAQLDAALAPLAEMVRLALSQLSDAARDIGQYARRVQDDPERLTEIDERLESLRRLSRKHGGDLASVLTRREQMREELEKLSGHEEHLASAALERARHMEAAALLARALTERRRQAATAFSEAVVERLGDLEMKKTVFEVRVSAVGLDADGSVEGEGIRLTPRGQDAVEFMLSPNPGEEPKALARIASGGELSRVMLAVKRVLAERDPVETYVFDEVDAGIGGATGEVVGRMIREVAGERQVLCITHLAQIAAYAEAHYTVQKGVKDDGRTHSSLTRLSAGDAREHEIARMLSGHLSPASLAHAHELLEKGSDLGAGKRPRKPRKTA